MVASAGIDTRNTPHSSPPPCKDSLFDTGRPPPAQYLYQLQRPLPPLVSLRTQYPIHFRQRSRNLMRHGSEPAFSPTFAFPMPLYSLASVAIIVSLILHCIATHRRGYLETVFFCYCFATQYTHSPPESQGGFACAAYI